MSFPLYPKYKPSGVEWLGDVPEGWGVKRLRFVANLNPSKSEIADLDRGTAVSFLPMESVGDDGVLTLDKEKTIAELETGFTYFRNGDVTIAKITPCYENGKGALMCGLTNGIGFGTTELIVARPMASQITSTYLHYLFISPDFRGIGESHMYGAGGQKRVPDAFVRNFATAIPPLPEQTAIAEFLDRETGKIDGLVAEQRRLMELLKEKRQAVISHAVTKGLNPHAPMKPSGIEWLGDVPEHWDCVRNKVVFEEISERSISEEGELMTVSHITGVTPRSQKDVNMFLAETLDGYKKCRRGDLVINTMWAWMGALGCSPCDGLVSPAYNIYRPRNARRLSPAYYDYLCRLPAHVVTMKANSTGVWESRLRLYPDAFLSMRLPVPPLKEQLSIVEYLSIQTAEWDTLTAEAQRAIDLLQERRTALISAAVTGQIDVRGSHPPQPVSPEGKG